MRPFLLVLLLASPLLAGEPPFFRVDVEVPKDTKGTVHVALDAPVKDKDAWAPDGVALEKGKDGHWRGEIPASRGLKVLWKVTRGDWETVEKDADGKDIPNRETKVARDGSTVEKVMVARWADEATAAEEVASLSSSVVALGRMKPKDSTLPSRPIFAWLPPGYDKGERRYPVLYVLDGQNQLDPKRSFQGVTWGLNVSGEAHVAAGHQAFIAVCIDNAREQRADEYLPSRVKGKNGEAGGKLEELVQFILEQVKPLVDSKFRTKPGAADTGIMGSSFGGMAAFHIGWKHSDAFGRVAAVSPSFWWNKQETKALVAATKKKPAIKLWVDMGTGEEPNDEEASKRHIEGARAVRDALLGVGFEEGKDLRYVEDEGAVHNEAAWAKRLPDILRFLFP